MDGLEREYPWIPWREPVLLPVAGQPARYGCRLCAARLGIRDEDMVSWQIVWDEEEVVRAHLMAWHREEGP